MIGLAGALTCVACKTAYADDPAVLAQIQALERTQQQRRTELEQVQSQITTAQEQLRQEQLRVEQARCDASRTEVQAAASRLAADCLELQLRHAQCTAAAARSAADNTMGGMLIGAALAVLTGGAAAPLMAGGAMAGRTVAGASGACGIPPSCSLEPSDHVATALRERGLEALPTCSHETSARSSCSFRAPRQFYLRDHQAIDDIGPLVPAGTRIRILRSGVLVRPDGLRATHVRLGDRRQGWMFLSEDDIRTHRCVREL